MNAEKDVTDGATLARYHDAWDRADHAGHGTPIDLKPKDVVDRTA